MIFNLFNKDQETKERAIALKLSNKIEDLCDHKPMSAVMAALLTQLTMALKQILKDEPDDTTQIDDILNQLKTQVMAKGNYDDGK